jgi:hypothetical protein
MSYTRIAEAGRVVSDVCATGFLFHYLFDVSQELHASIIRLGLRPLSDFPESRRWHAIAGELPGFFERLYHDWAAPVLGLPYRNSGVFLTPIDYRRLPDHFMGPKPRVRVPLGRIVPTHAVLTYEWRGRRIRLPVTREHLAATAERWTAERIRRWFGRDQTRLFYFVPQVVTYQPGGVSVEPGGFEWPPRADASTSVT